MLCKRTLLLRIFAFAVVYSTSVVAQKIETGFLDRSVTVGGAEYRFQVYVPRGFNKKQTWPIIVALHGGGEYGSDGMRHTKVGLAPAIRRNPEPAIARREFSRDGKQIAIVRGELTSNAALITGFR